EWLKPAIFFGSILYAMIGVLVFWISFLIVDKVTPYDLWSEIVEKKNVALAIVVGAMCIAIGLIVSDAIHGWWAMCRWISVIGLIVACIAARTGHWLVGLLMLAGAIWLWWLDTPDRQRRRESSSDSSGIFSPSLPSFSPSLMVN